MADSLRSDTDHRCLIGTGDSGKGLNYLSVQMVEYGDGLGEGSNDGDSIFGLQGCCSSVDSDLVRLMVYLGGWKD